MNHFSYLFITLGSFILFLSIRYFTF